MMQTADLHTITNLRALKPLLLLLLFCSMGTQAWGQLPYNTTMTQAHYNDSKVVVGKDGARYPHNTWDGGIKLEAGGVRQKLFGGYAETGTEWNWDDKYVIIALKTNSIPYQLQFKYKCSSIIASNPDWYVAESSDKSNWTQIWSTESNSTSKSDLQTVNLSKSTKYIKFCYSGNYGGTYSDIKVTDQAYVHNPKVEDDEITSLDFGTGTISSGKAELTFDIEWCNVSALSVTSNNTSYFTVSPSSFGQTAKYGTQTVSVYYDRDVAVGDHSGVITISNGTAKYTKTVNVSGSTTKRSQEIHWNADLAAVNYTMNAEENLTGDAIATADNEDAVLTYESTNDNVIAVSPDGKTLYAISNGIANVTATATGNDIYDEGTDTKTFTVTSKKKQTITWNDVLLGLKTNASPNTMPLTATATSNGTITYAIEGGSASCITLSGTNNATLTITGTPGEAYIIATQAGGKINGEDWIEATARKKVTVRDPNADCDEYALADESFTFGKGDKENMSEKEFSLSGKPTQLSFSAKRGGLKFLWSEQKPMIIDQYANFGSGLEWRQLTTIMPSDSRSNYGPYTLEETATKIRFRSGEYAEQQVTNISVPRKRELVVSETNIVEDAERNVKWSKTISVTRSNIDVVDLTITSSDETCPFVLNKTSIGTDCSDRSTETFEVSFTPKEKGKTYTGTITITDGKAVPTTRTIDLTITTVAFNQAITWNFADNQEFLSTHEALSFDATTDATDLEVSYRLGEGDDARATLVDNNLTFKAAGTIHVIAYQEGNDRYNAAEERTKTIVIIPDTPIIAKKPTAGEITYLQTLSNSTINQENGKATVTFRGAPNHVVEGTWVWTNKDYQVVEQPGNHDYEVTFTPKGAEKDMYTTNTCDVTITVNPAGQAISMNPGSVYVKVDGIDKDATDSRLDLSTLIASQTNDSIDAERDGVVTFEKVSAQNNADNINTVTINGNIFTATACDVYTVRARKAGTDYYNEATAEFTVTVGKRTNTLELIDDPEPQYVDNVVGNVVKADKHNSNADIHTESTAGDIARYDKNNNRIIIPNEQSASFTDTTVTISIWQEANDQFEESGVKTITLTVQKCSNEIYYTWDGNNGTTWVEFLNFDQSANVTFSAKNKEDGCPEIVIDQTSGATNATYNEALGKITASHNDASSAVWTISQAESRKYSGASRTLTVNVGTIASEGCNLISLHYDNEKTASQIHIPMPEVGTAGVLTFTMKRNHSAGNDAKLWTLVGTTWTGRDIRVPNNSDSYVAYPSITLDPNTVAIRFDKSAIITGHYTFDDPYINDIQVTRRTWLKLQDAAKDEIHELNIPTNTVSIGGTNSRKAKFYVDYSTCDDVVRLSSSNPSKIQVSPSEFTPDHFGRKEITVTYTSNTLETIYDSITVYTANENKKLYIKTKTEKENQSIIWNDGFIGDPMTLPLGLTASNAATSTSGYLVTYTAGNDNIISISADGLSFSIIGTGTTTLTARADGDDTHWKSVEDTKTVKATGKKVQFIKWNNDYTYGLHPNDVADLDAVAMVPNYSTGVSSANDSLSALITYTCLENDDNVIQIIAGNKLKMLKPGDAKIQASLAGSAEYEAAEPVVLNVHVRAVSAGDCQTPLMFESDGELQFYQFDFKIDPSELPNMLSGKYKWTPEIVNYVIINHDNTSGEPDKLTFKVRGEAYTQSFGLFSHDFFVGDIDVYQSIDGGNTWGEKLATVDAQQDQTVPSGEIQLDPKATHLKFVRPENGAGTHYVSDIKITRLPAISSEVAKVNGLPEVDLGDVMVGAEHRDYITFEYASVKGDLVVSKQNSTNEKNELIINEPVIELDCGAFDTHDLPITLHPTVVGSWSEEVKIEDPISGLSYTVRVKANVTGRYVFNGKEDADWTNPKNWEVGSVPTKDFDVIINSHVELDKEEVVNGITLTSKGSITIAPTGGLTVGKEGIKGATTSNLILKAGDATAVDKEGNSVTGQTGFLRIDPECEESMPEATVQMLRKGYSSGYSQNQFGLSGYMTWQYIGCPINYGENTKIKEVVGGWMNSWNEENGTWVNDKYSAEFKPFIGFANSQNKSADGALTEYKGQLFDNDTYNVSLTYHGESDLAGWNLLANSFAAPIDIKAMFADNSMANVEHAVYLFNTGNTESVVGDAGTYTPITKALAGTKEAEKVYQGVIPSMQGFFVKAMRACQFTFNYKNVVWDAVYTEESKSTPMRAPKHNDASKKQVVSISLEANGQRDKVLLIEEDDYSTDFENGYDAHIMPVGSLNIFTIEGEDDYLAIDATNSIIGTRVGVRTGEETTYKMTFTYLDSEDELALLDTETNQTTDIDEGTEYTFYAEPNSEILGRFQIVGRAKAPSTPTGVNEVEFDVKVHKFIKDNQLYILKNGVLYDGMGAVVR